MSGDNPAATFRLEALDVMDEVERALLDLGQRLDDAQLIDAVFRGLHTVKGSGAMFGFDDLADFTHHCESAFDKVRKGLVPATGELVSVILAACDHMRGLIAAEADVAAGQVFLDGLSAAMAGAQGVAPVTASPAAAHWRIRYFLPSGCMANGINPLALLTELRELGDCQITALTDAIPPLAELEPTDCHIGWEVELSGAITREDIEDVFLFVLDDMEITIEQLAGESTPANDCPPAADLAPATIAEADRTTKNTARVSETVRVPADRLDDLMNRVGELVIAQSRLSQLAEDSQNIALRSVSEEIERLAGDRPGLGIPQRDVRRHLELAGGVGDLAVSDGAIRRLMRNHALFGRAFGCRHIPRSGSRLDQHHARGGSAFTNVFVRFTNAAAAAG